MSNSLQILCIKDTEGYWTEGEMYPARVVAGGFVQVGGIEGDVLFEEASHD
ncbi:hypothetical protein [Klebsiella pneumoniae]|uniref:hypothetical protein n=1 Tax=Klebsiella pneumoniae TaxID=573 RepID=UPI0018679FBA|nr:hypothetical protein [Klebsiella pneumoniae]MBE3231566.1 hypothetical protein [Klebsiella pneumoniae]MCF1868482.1 hypothetical protein [Klebsiella pneumoniae]